MWRPTVKTSARKGNTSPRARAAETAHPYDQAHKDFRHWDLDCKTIVKYVQRNKRGNKKESRARDCKNELFNMFKEIKEGIKKSQEQETVKMTRQI